MKILRTVGALCLVGLGLSWAGPSRAWDSRLENGFQLGLPLHVQHTLFSVDRLKQGFPEFHTYGETIVKGALTELHELPTKTIDLNEGRVFDLDLEAKRKQHKGTNEGCDDMAGWWADAVDGYNHGRKQQAWYIVGIMLHMIEDMGVPAHANKVYHQGNLKEFDNFEFNATVHGSYLYRVAGTQIVQTIDMGRVNRGDPQFREPWRYYEFSKQWAHADAPDYNDRDKFPKARIWPFWVEKHSELMQNRQQRTRAVAEWALRSAALYFRGTPNPNN